MNICNVISHKFYIKTHKNKKHKPERVICVSVQMVLIVKCLNYNSLFCCHDNCKGGEGKNKKICSGAFYEVSKNSRWGLKKYCQITHASRDLKNKIQCIFRRGTKC